MKYTPREISENVNVSKVSPLREFFVLTFGIAGLLIGVYIILGLALNWVIPRISPQLEDRLSTLFAFYYNDADTNSPENERLQQLMNELESHAELHPRDYQVHLIEEEMINAMALPGGHVVVFSGLIESMGSQNELAMVLAHELGHFQNRDHLRGLGRGLVLMFLSSSMLGIDSTVSKVLQSMLVNTEMRFSQEQEMQSDAWGLEFLVGMYGHAGGATDFFQRMSETENPSRAAYFFATHPYPEKRVEALERIIQEKNYPILETEPLDPLFLD